MDRGRQRDIASKGGSSVPVSKRSFSRDHDLAVRAGRTSGGLPVGVRAVADFKDDRTALAAAGRISGILGGFQPPPGYGA